jgi:hypothetical protein
VEVTAGGLRVEMTAVGPGVEVTEEGPQSGGDCRGA